MDKKVDSKDDLSKLIMSIGSISKGFGGKGKRMGETASFNVNFRQNADPEIKDYFLKTYGEHPEKINFFLPCNEIEKCIIAPYTTFNASQTLLARSDGEFFTYIANLENPLNKAEPYLRNGFRCSDGEKIPHQPDLGFLGKPNAKMKMTGQMFVFIRELLEAGVFQTMAFKFHTIADRDMLLKRLMYIRDFASRINVPVTAVPIFLTKYRKVVPYKDASGTIHNSEHFYLDLGMGHCIGTNNRHPLSSAFSVKNDNFPVRYEPASISANKENLDPETDIPVSDGTFSREETLDVQADSMFEPVRSQQVNSDDRWQEEVFMLSDDQQAFVRENVSPYSSRYGIKPEFLTNYKDKFGTAISDLELDNVLSQTKTADEYLLKLRNKEIMVDKQTEMKAKKRRWALITVALIKQNKYNFY